MASSFDKLGLDPALIEAMKMENITAPTEIQESVIPLILDNADVIGQSQTGSGKTLAYLLPLFNRVSSGKRETQVIILAPTHELVMQIDREIKKLAANSKIPINSVPIIGEVNIKRQLEKLREKPQIIVGSTGRILELIKSRKINAQTVRTIVIDEGDRLLDEHNSGAVREVIKTTLRDRQLLVFSATISNRALNIASELMVNPQVVKIEEKKIVNSNIEHLYLIAEQRDKLTVLRKLVAAVKPKRAIVFINKSEEIELTTLKLQYHHLSAYGIYGSAKKEERKKALEGFRSGKIQLLVASDLAARGLDIKDVSHIFNLDLPQDPKEYLHRVGRTGRAMNSGTAISIVTLKELSLIHKYEKDLGIKILPKDIARGKVFDKRNSKDFPTV